MELKRGNSYKRSEIHESFGGQEQSGIVTPARYPLIFLFSTPSGERYGYVDGWMSDGLYRYTGEGQVGDMTITRGNKAVTRHEVDGEELHLFESTKEAAVTYVGEMKYVRHEWEEGLDREGNKRKVVLFYLARA